MVRAEQREITEWDEYTGRLAAPDSVEVRARVSGHLESIHFKDGQIVEKGDLLFVIDPRPYQADQTRAEAAVRQAEAQAMLAQSNLQRSQQLRQKSVIAQEDLDTAANTFKAAEAAVEAARAGVKGTWLNLDFTRVEAPIRGRISRNFVSVGNLVTGGAANTTLLTTVVSLDPIHAYFEVDERSYLKYQKIVGNGQFSAGKTDEADAARTPMGMELANESGFPHEGFLDFVDNRVDLESGTVQLRGVFANPDLRLTPGLFARVRIPARLRGPAILIPDQAIGTDQSQQFVLVVGADNKAVYRKVELGPIVDKLRVVRSGVEAQERVVVTGMQSARPGAEVRAEEKAIGAIVNGAGPTQAAAVR